MVQSINDIVVIIIISTAVSITTNQEFPYWQAIDRLTRQAGRRSSYSFPHSSKPKQLANCISDKQ